MFDADPAPEPGRGGTLVGRAGPRRSTARHRTILEAAAALAGEVGYAAATIEAIAARAGAGKQTIYRWWPSKAALYLEVYTHLVPASELRADTGSVTADLSATLARLFALYRDTPAATILGGLITEAQADDAAARVLRDGLVVGRRRLLIEPIERGIARGELPADFDAAEANETIVARIWHRLLTRPDGLDDAFAAHLATVAVPAPKGP